MAEPIGPEAYLAIAASVNTAFSSYREKKGAEQIDKPTSISTGISKSSLKLHPPTDELLSDSGLKVGNDSYVQWVTHSPAHPRNWSRKRKAYDLAIILFSEFIMSGISAVGVPASLDGSEEVLGHTREVGLVAFTTMYVERGFGAPFPHPARN